MCEVMWRVEPVVGNASVGDDERGGQNIKVFFLQVAFRPEGYEGHSLASFIIRIKYG